MRCSEQRLGAAHGSGKNKKGGAGRRPYQVFRCPRDQAMSKRSRFITLDHAFTKSRTKAFSPSFWP